jgi:hypothetical protein
MPKLLPARCRPDSIQEFRVAARQRFRDAVSLAESDQLLAAVYLWGYAAEMVVKAAYFSALGFADDRPITIADLNNAKGSAGGLGFVWSGNLHRIDQWGQLLNHQNRPYRFEGVRVRSAAEWLLAHSRQL